MAKQNNTNFRLGLNRQELIEAVQQFGKTEKSAKKSNTKRLEQFLTTQLGGKGTKVPDLSDKNRIAIRETINVYGLQEGLNTVAYRIKKASGTQNEDNAIRLSLRREFAAYLDDEAVTNAHVDELYSRISFAESKNEIISGISTHRPYYKAIFENYLAELQERK